VWKLPEGVLQSSKALTLEPDNQNTGGSKRPAG